MLDIKIIRADKDKVNELLQRRNPELNVNEVIGIDEKRRSLSSSSKW